MEEQSLETLRAFMNSHHNEGIDDFFESPAVATRQLADIGLTTSRRHLTQQEAVLLRRVRDALNGLIAGSYVAEDVDFDQVAQELPLRLRLDSEGLRTELDGVAAGVPGIAARMLGLAHDAMSDGTWDRLTTCANKDDCSRVFLDRSKNHSRVWCDMATCGAQAKSRAFREREREKRQTRSG